jgi:hypothetical protein
MATGCVSSAAVKSRVGFMVVEGLGKVCLSFYGLALIFVPYLGGVFGRLKVTRC